MLAFEDEYLQLEIDAATRLVRQTRKPRAFEDVPSLVRSIDGLVSGMRNVRRAEFGLLQDMRAARGRNDPQFEAAIASEGIRMNGGFRRVAVLVTSHVGLLQVQRFLQRDQITGRAFIEEAEALRYLSEP
jgi:hypothetical protein